MSFLAELNELNYVPKAEEVIQSLRVPEKNGDGYKLMLTTSKIRNLLSMITDIYNTVSMRLDEKLDNDILGVSNTSRCVLPMKRVEIKRKRFGSS